MRLSGWHLRSSQAASRLSFNDKSISSITLLASWDTEIDENAFAAPTTPSNTVPAVVNSARPYQWI
jgi:hypothetical protein